MRWLLVNVVKRQELLAPHAKDIVAEGTRGEHIGRCNLASFCMQPGLMAKLRMDLNMHRHASTPLLHAFEARCEDGLPA